MISAALSYPITPSTPTEVLFTLGRYFSEVGAYFSTILSAECLSLSKKCSRKLTRVVTELKKRKAIDIEDDLFNISATPDLALAKDTEGIKKLSIPDLELLYLRVSEPGLLDPDARLSLQRNIVEELGSREASSPSDQLKISYCLDTFQNELSYLSSLQP